jgi:hypothetical protein
MTANFSGSINPGNNVKAPFFGNGFGVGFMAYRRRNKLQHVA